MFEFWPDLLERGRGWYWMVLRESAGDVFQVCSLARGFVEQHGSKHPIFLVVSSPAHAEVARLYGEFFQEIIIAPEAPRVRTAWLEFFHHTRLPTFGLETPILLNWDLSLEFYPSSIPEETATGWMPVLKQLLHLRPDSEPTPPARNRTFHAKAARLCEAHGIGRGDSVLLFPYAQCFAAPTTEPFTRLARALTGRGLRVFTSVAPGEAAIEGTQGVFIPFSLLLDVAEYAGRVVALRSGLVDILASARCRKSFLYRSHAERQAWSVRMMDFARDADEQAFAFDAGDPDDFVEMVLAGGPNGRLHTARTAGLSDLVGAGDSRAEVPTFSLADAQRRRRGWEADLASMADILGRPSWVMVLHDVPARDATRWSELVEAVVAACIQAVSETGAVVHACRDHVRRDFIEEVSLPALKAGRYHAADFWHTLILTRAPLAGLLPPAARDYLVPTGAPPIGERVEFSWAACDTRRASEIANAPPSYSGLTLIDGWAGPEGWGVWGVGRRSVVKFRLGRAGSVTLSLGVRACISERFAELAVTVFANGVQVHAQAVSDRVELTRIDIPIPSEVVSEDPDLWIVIECDEVRSPADQGASGDRRPLSLGLCWARLAPAPLVAIGATA